MHGSGGTGKTFVYNTLCNFLRSQGKIVLCVASSGIAALLLSGGRTSHFRFKIPLAVHDTSQCFINKNSNLGKLIRQTSLIIWDEVPMQNKFCFQAVDKTLQDVCGKEGVLFGGINVIFGGDFAQIPPVVKNGNRAATVESSIKRSYLWSNIVVLQLSINMRVTGLSNNDIHFKNWLIDMSYNREFHSTNIYLPTYLHQTKKLKELISAVYPPSVLQRALVDGSYFYKSAILTTRNATVDSINEQVLKLMPGKNW